jgi:hypothetical protein
LQQQFSPEPEIDLADFINIEEVSPTSEGVPTPLVPIATPSQSMEVDSYSRSASSTTTEVLQTPSPTTALSPFAGKQSFNLDTLWNNPKEQQDEEEAHTAAPPPASPPPLSPPTIKEDEFEGEDMVESPIEQVEDQDFDMFLQDKEAAGEGASKAGPPPPLTVESLPEVWKGMVSIFSSSFYIEHSLILFLRSRCLLIQAFLKRRLWSPVRLEGRHCHPIRYCGRRCSLRTIYG